MCLSTYYRKWSLWFWCGHFLKRKFLSYRYLYFPCIFLFRAELSNKKFFYNGFCGHDKFVFVYAIRSSGDSATNSSRSNETLFCIQLPVFNHSTTFCGINQPWKPRISKPSGIVAIVIPSLVAWILTGVLICVGGANRKELKKQEGFAAVVIYHFKVIVDAVDATLDSYLFYQLELSEIVDKNITRNLIVNTAILVFAALGALKIIISIYSAIDAYEYMKQKWSKLFLFMFAFVFEDGPELVLEYFYIEKYVTQQPLWYLLIKDVIISMITAHSFFSIFKLTWCDKKKEGRFFHARPKIFCDHTIVDDSLNVYTSAGGCLPVRN